MGILIGVFTVLVPLILAVGVCGALAVRRRYGLGFGLGLVILWMPLLVIVTVYLPRPSECAASPLACEWVGIGLWIYTLMALSSTLAYLPAAWVIRTWQRRFVDPAGKARLLPGAGKQATSLGLGLVVSALVGAGLGMGVHMLVGQGVFTT